MSMPSVMRMFPAVLFLIISSTSPVAAEIIVSTVAQLVAAVNNTQNGGNRTILIADGNYPLNGSYLRIAVNDVTVKSQSDCHHTRVLPTGKSTPGFLSIMEVYDPAGHNLQTVQIQPMAYLTITPGVTI